MVCSNTINCPFQVKLAFFRMILTTYGVSPGVRK